MKMKDTIVNTYRTRFGADPAHIVRAPGRVNLIGEHTDYNDGFVLPMAIDRHSWIALSPRTDGTVRIEAVDYDESAEFVLSGLKRDKTGWAEYAKGVAWSLGEDGYELKGWQGVNACDVPMGAGLSSSAAFELAVARAFAAVSGFEWDATHMALLAQKAENQWVGMNCGIMDQMISAKGRQGKAVLIDCRDLSTRAVPLPPGTAVVIMDTSTRRGLVDSAYNERRRQCEAAARHFGVKALRDVSLERFEREANALDDVARRRARHVITENDRTLQAAEAMDAGDAAALGVLMNASHESLRDDFEVTNRELDVMVKLAQAAQGCMGARMTGAGFGGCAVALIKADAADRFSARVSEAYRTETGLDPALYVCLPSNGAEEI